MKYLFDKMDFDDIDRYEINLHTIYIYGIIFDLNNCAEIHFDEVHFDEIHFDEINFHPQFSTQQLQF